MLTRTTGLVLATALLILSACDPDDGPETSTTTVENLEIVTGINLSDANGNPIGRVGTPNDFGSVTVYPSPAHQFQALQFFQGNIQAVWIVPATQDTSFSQAEVEDAFENFAGYDTTALSAAEVRQFKFEEPDIQAINLDVSDLTTGHYRVLVEDGTGTQHAVSTYYNNEVAPPMLLDTLFKLWRP